MLKKLTELFSDNSQAIFWYSLAALTILASAFFTHNYIATFWTYQLPEFFGIKVAITFLLGIICSFVTTLLGLTFRDVEKTKSIISAGQKSDNWIANFFCHSYTLGAIAFIVLFTYGLDWISSMEGIAIKNATQTVPFLPILTWKQLATSWLVFGSDICVALGHISSGKSVAGGSSSSSRRERSRRSRHEAAED